MITFDYKILISEGRTTAVVCGNYIFSLENIIVEEG
jgi:hypothetical protein